MAKLWEVVGGVGKGGILAREGKEFKSSVLETRLSTGALVEERELVDERLHFKLVSGTGPAQGWVSVTMANNGRELLRRFTGTVQHPLDMDALRAACRDAGVEPLPTATEADLRAALAELGVSLERATAVAGAAVGQSRETPNQAESVVLHADSSQGNPRDRHGERQSFEGEDSTSTTGKAAWIAEVQAFDASETDPYQLFGIPYDATDAVIKSSFRKLSLKVHPDRCPEDAEAANKFQQLSLAKEFLLDPFRRRAFNEAHGFLTPTQNVAWWVDWDDIFAEIEPDSEINAADAVPPPIANNSRIDVLILGATGLTGTLACMVMQRQTNLGRTWAIAGRDGRKLQLLEHKFGQGSCFQRSFRVSNRRDLENTVRAARVVLDFTGPPHDVGTDVVEACIRAGTHWIDNSGEIMHSRNIKDTLDTKAKRAKVCLLVHAGWVSVPADLGVWRLVGNVREKFGLPTRKVDVYTYTQGFVMSGTSLLTGTKQTMEQLRNAGGPFVLGGVRPEGVRKEDYAMGPQKDENSPMIAFPGLNIERQVVRGTCGLMDEIEPYGDNFLFKDWFLIVDKQPEKMTKQESAQASRLQGMGAALSGGQQMMVEQKKIPPPGWGPKERIRQETFVSKVFVAVADCGEVEGESLQKLHCVMNAGPGGVGDRYEGTAAMMIEAASCMLDTIDQSRSSLRFGWGTPVYHLAHLGFWERLVSLGFSFSFFDGAPSSEFMQRVFSATLPITM